MVQKPKFVYAKQVAAALGISLRTAYRWLHRVRQWFGKDPKAPVTVDELARWLGMKKYELEELLYRRR